MEFADVVKRRRSVRRYSDRQPAPEVVDRIIDTARRAPTGGFSQGIDFLVIDDPEQLATFWRMATPPDHDPDGEFARSVRLPPMVVVVFSDPERYLARYSAEDKIQFGLDDADAWPVRYWDIDAGMAAMLLQLAAVNEGIDTWFFGIDHGEDDIREHFGVPTDRNMIGIVGLGYRSEDEAPIGSGVTRRRRPLGEQLHRNRW